MCTTQEDTGITKRRTPTHQIAAIPVRRDETGALQVLLVTSRETRRWVIPKGWPFDDLADHLAAGEEAWEEAGVRGKLKKKAIGVFHYDKRRRNDVIPIEVAVYRLEVDQVFDTWPESHQRERAWFTIADAAEAIGELELQALILALE